MKLARRLGDRGDEPLQPTAFERAVSKWQRRVARSMTASTSPAQPPAHRRGGARSARACARRRSAGEHDRAAERGAEHELAVAVRVESGAGIM